MSDGPTTASTVADVAVLAVALERDAQLPGEERRSRNQRSSAIVEAVGGDRLHKALAWLDDVCAEDSELQTLRVRVRHALGWVGILMSALGLLFGWVAAIGALYYDGSGRINVLAVLAVFVFLPGLMLIPFGWAALPSRWLAWVPGGNATGAFFRSVSPGRLGGLALRWFPEESRRAWQRATGRVGAHRELYAGVQKWALLRWSQMFAIGFQVAAVTVAFWLVTFSDLAFGWSTTLTSGDPAEDARCLHLGTSALAAPWSWALEAAEPSRELVRESRYFRAVVTDMTPGKAAFLGGWWPFIILAMLFYGLLPRLMTLTISQRALNASVRGALLATPGLSVLLIRLRRAGVETASPETERWEAPGASLQGDPAGVTALPEGPFGSVINWASLPIEGSVLAAFFGTERILHAGGGSTLAHDKEVARGVAMSRGESDSVAIVVKAWEPPLLEFVDFVHALRSALGRGPEIVVVPLSLDSTATPQAALPAQVGIWRDKLEQAGDPWLRVVELPAEVSE